MKKLLTAFLISCCTVFSALAQTAITLPIAANAVADLGNGPIKVRMIAGNASIFTSQGSGVGSTSGSSLTLTLTATPATPPIVGALISGTGITSGTTVTAYNGTTGVTLSAAMTVAGGTTVSWGAACPSSVGGAPVIQASAQAGYSIMYTQARVCAVSPGGPVNTLLIEPIFYDQTAPGGGGGGGGVTPANATSANDTNVTLTLNGTPTGALLQAVQFQMGWTGMLAGARMATATTSTQGALPAWPNTATTYFRGDGTYQTLNCAALASVAASCGTDATNASNISSGSLALGRIAAIGANTVLSNWTAGSAVPAANTWPACANDGDHALVYVNGTGLVCGTITSGSGVTSVAQGANTTANPGAGVLLSTNPCTATCTAAIDPSVLPGFLGKLTTSNDPTNPNTTIDTEIGSAVSDDYTTFLKLGSAFTKTVSPWTLGSGNGCLDVGSVGNSLWYSLWLVGRTDTGVVDQLCSLAAGQSTTATVTIASPAVVTWTNMSPQVGMPVVFSTTGALPTGITPGTTYYVIAAGLTNSAFEFSATVGGSAINTSGSQSGTHTVTASPVLPANYTKKRRIAFFHTDGSAHIIKYRQIYDTFLYLACNCQPNMGTGYDISVGNPGTSPINVQLANAPVGARVGVLGTARIENTSAGAIAAAVSIESLDLTPPNLAGVFFNPGQNGSDPTTSLSTDTFVMTYTNPGAMVQYFLTASSAQISFLFTVSGWIDPRGK